MSQMAVNTPCAKNGSAISTFPGAVPLGSCGEIFAVLVGFQDQRGTSTGDPSTPISRLVLPT
jgi:hypothetical protein